MKIAQLLLAALVLVAVRVAMAAGGGHIPWSELIIPQIVNFSIVVLGLAFVLKSALKAHFSAKATAFAEQKEEATKIKQEAQLKNGEIKKLISELEGTAEKTLSVAKEQAASLRKQIVQDADVQAQKISEETRRSAKHEFDRAVVLLRTELVTNSVRFAENKIKEKMDQKVQDKLSQEFIDKVGAVRV